jgi:hypothetical protein
LHDQVSLIAVTADHVAATFASLAKSDEDRFDQMAEAVFRFQVASNPVYGRFAGDQSWDGWRTAPFLPIEAFKFAPIVCGDPSRMEAVFVSSGTTNQSRARHYVQDLSVYRTAVTTGFSQVFGDGPMLILAHLPGYQESGDASSLVTMASMLIDAIGEEGSGFTLQRPELLDIAISNGTPVMLLGAAFGLLDMLDLGPRALPTGSIVVETGGMKTHRREISRSDLHQRLSEGFGIPRSSVLSEYGMCELLSQSYSRGDEEFYPPPWVRIQIVDPSDPSRRLPEGVPGALAIVDLANVYSASFILTQDRAVIRDDGFQVLGRLSGAELRGCNFLVER